MGIKPKYPSYLNVFQSGINCSALVGNENGDVMVPTYDAVNFLKPHFKKVEGIKSHHYFDFCVDNLGVVAMREFGDSSPTTVQVLSTLSCPMSRPTPLMPNGKSTCSKKLMTVVLMCNYATQRQKDWTKTVECNNVFLSFVCETTQALVNDSSDSGDDYLKTIITGIYCTALGYDCQVQWKPMHRQ